MHEDLEKVKLLARDMRDGKEFPRSPRATLGGYVLAARAVDKCRAVLVDWQGEYHSKVAEPFRARVMRARARGEGRPPRRHAVILPS